MANLIKKILSSQSGSVAIMLVLSTVAIVTPFVLNFEIDTSINQLKVENIADRSQAKLTAESGLQFAMARLKLYKEAYNFLQTNENAQSVVQPELLNSLWNFPFVYPIPIGKKLNAIQKEAIKKFEKETLLVGTMTLTISNISNRINLNLLRLSLIADEIKSSQTDPADRNPQQTDEDQEFTPEAQLIKILQDALVVKSDEDELFQARYAGTEIPKLVNELKFYISDPNAIENAAGGDQNFQGGELSAKRAPLSSYSELHLLPEWPDDISNLIRSEFTIHGALMIDLNKITERLLRILIPNIDPQEIKAFFEYKNKPQDPKYFNSLEDFKNYIVGTANIMNGEDFDDRFASFAAQGLQFGETPTLFKVIVGSTVGRATYTLTAYISIPPQPKPRIQDPNDTDALQVPAVPEEGEPAETTNPNPQPNPDQPTLLLDPRVVEIIIS